ncbi:MAG: signal recognition particle receptor subunit alpha [Candidatus Micrarchaeia archaeon]
MDFGIELRRAIMKLRGAKVVDKKTLDEFIKDFQKALLSGDVETSLVYELGKKIKEKASIEKIPKNVDEREFIIKVVYDELYSILKNAEYQPEIRKKKILLVGLYGSGKTTTAAKLAKYYQDRGIGACLVCCDTSRPAAFEQLLQLSKKINVEFFGIENEKDSSKIAEEAIKKITKKILIFDSSGRSAFEKELIEELIKLKNIIQPDETFLVLSADIGQIASKQAQEFNKNIGIDGVIITKMDGSAKGGGALSAIARTGAKIAFIGTGEAINELEVFDANAYLSRLLGIPNIQLLVEKVKEQAQPKEIEELNFDTFLESLKTMKNLGLMKIFSMLGNPDIPREFVDLGEEKMKKYEAIILSMTKDERKKPELLKNQSRIARIAKGSGVKEEDVKELILNFEKMKKMMQKFQKDRRFAQMFKKFGLV